LFKLLINIIYVKKYTGLYQTKAACFQYKIKECDGACIGWYLKEYNLRVSAFITNNSFENQNMVIVEKGRTVNERSAV
jgi:DNA polymerase-3 subunit epsilon